MLQLQKPRHAFTNLFLNISELCSWIPLLMDPGGFSNYSSFLSHNNLLQYVRKELLLLEVTDRNPHSAVAYVSQEQAQLVAVHLIVTS